jgi:hypothetical protein
LNRLSKSKRTREKKIVRGKMKNSLNQRQLQRYFSIASARITQRLLLKANMAGLLGLEEPRLAAADAAAAVAVGVLIVNGVTAGRAN